MNLPIFFENSKVPVILSKLSPIEIAAITLGPFVFSKEKISDRTRNHEAIHWEQYKETLIFGFLFLYVVYWLIGLMKYRNRSKAYYQIPFEQEAYENDVKWPYIIYRRRFAWLRYKI